MATGSTKRAALLCGLGLCVAFLVAGCNGSDSEMPAAREQGVQAPTARRLTGTVTYRERIALPPDASIEVELVDVSRSDEPSVVLASAAIAADGKQVPIAFELAYEPSLTELARRYALRASIRGGDGELLFESAEPEQVLALGAPTDGIALVVRRASGAEPAAAEPVAQPTPEPAATELVAVAPTAGGGVVNRTFVFDCGPGVSFTIRHGPGEVALWAPRSLGGGYHVLAQTRSGSGARYEEDGRVFWNKGNLATIEYDGRTFVDCESNPAEAPWADAARRGVTFRAVGNEPGWLIEIDAERLVLLTAYGERRNEFPLSTPTTAGVRTTYRASADGHEVVAVLERAGCTDAMSGAAFEASAIVTLDGAMLYGCGRFL